MTTNERLAAQVALLATQLVTAAEALLADDFDDQNRRELADVLVEVARDVRPEVTTS